MNTHRIPTKQKPHRIDACNEQWAKGASSWRRTGSPECSNHTCMCFAMDYVNYVKNHCVLQCVLISVVDYFMIVICFSLVFIDVNMAVIDFLLFLYDFHMKIIDAHMICIGFQWFSLISSYVIVQWSYGFIGFHWFHMIFIDLRSSFATHLSVYMDMSSLPAQALTRALLMQQSPSYRSIVASTDTAILAARNGCCCCCCCGAQRLQRATLLLLLLLRP